MKHHQDTERTVLTACAIALRLVCVAMGVCALVAPVHAQDTKIGESPFEVIGRWKPKADVPEMPDFVRQSRPQDKPLDYIPIKRSDPDRPARKTPEELQRTISGLDAAAGANKRRAGGDFRLLKAKPATKAERKSPPRS